MWDGPEDELTLTENAQPALMAASMAALRCWKGVVWYWPTACRMSRGTAREYTALTAAGALQLEDTARLLKLRGQAMQRAVPVGVGAMAALWVDFEAVAEIAEEAATSDEIAAANDNANARVISHGGSCARLRLCQRARCQAGDGIAGQRAFHCALMQPAADEMQAALAETTINVPCVPLIANVTAQAVSDGDTIRDLLRNK